MHECRHKGKGSAGEILSELRAGPTFEMLNKAVTLLEDAVKSAAAYSAAGWGRPIVTHDTSATAGNHRTKAA